MGADHDHVDCTEAVHVLYEFLDGELSEGRRVEIQAHLEACLPCWEAFDFEAELKLFVGRKCRDTAPEALRLRVLGLIGDDPPDHPSEGMFRA
jgi:mycothiol system anti-sigma-R factor